MATGPPLIAESLSGQAVPTEAYPRAWDIGSALQTPAAELEIGIRADEAQSGDALGSCPACRAGGATRSESCVANVWRPKLKLILTRGVPTASPMCGRRN